MTKCLQKTNIIRDKGMNNTIDAMKKWRLLKKYN